MDPLSITRVKLTNVKGFAKCDAKIADGSSSILISGDNGNGKSTFLRSIALGLSDQMGAYGLISELSGSFINYAASNAKIEIFLRSKSGCEYKTETRIKLVDKFGTEQISQHYFQKMRNNRYKKINSDEFPLYDLFCTAYGAGNRTFGKERYHLYYQTDSVYQLFKVDSSLTEQELSIRRILEFRQENKRSQNKTIEKRTAQIWKLLRQVLNLPPATDIQLENNGIFFIDDSIRDRDGRAPKTELTSMGDGVRAITTMLLDIMSWWNLYISDIPEEEWDESESGTKSAILTSFEKFHGIVLIDEIELHLHPEWQRKIIGSLLNAFPNVQFIFTTHAAMCVAGATDIGRSSKIQFNRVGNGKCEEIRLRDGSSVDDVLRSKAFGLQSTMSQGFDNEVALISDMILSRNKKSSIENEIDNRISELEKENPIEAQFLRTKWAHKKFQDKKQSMKK